MQMAAGDRIRLWTQDCFEGRVKTEADRPTQVTEMPFINPQCGPIVIDGAEKGDALAVHIESIKPWGDNPRGTCCLIPEFGGLTGTTYTATLDDPPPASSPRSVPTWRCSGQPAA